MSSWAYDASARPFDHLRIMMTGLPRLLTFCCFAAFLLISSDGLAISSSKSSKRKSLTNANRQGGGGFGTKKEPTLLHVPDTSKQTQSLIHFLLSQKSEGFSGETQIGFDADTGLRGLYACKNMKKGEIICKIPSDCALALSDPALGGDDAPTIAHLGRNFLLMYDQDPNNRKLWAPYLDTLPTRESLFDPTPDFFSDEEIEQLEFPRLMAAARKRKSEVAAVAAEANMSLEHLQFATWIASSRSFSIQITVPDSSPNRDEPATRAVAKPQNTIRVLVPFLDMINHDSDNPNAELHLIDPEKDDAWFAIRATKPIAAGKEILLTYGSGVDSSVELFLNYGFVPSNNKIDAIMLQRSTEGSIESLDGWKTTLEEDLEALESSDGNMKNILQLRIKLKKAYEKK